MEGELTYTLGPDSGVGLAFAHRGPRTTAAVDLRVGVGAVGVTAAVVRRVGPRHHARLAGKLGTMGIEAEAGAGKKIDEGSVVYCGVSAVGRGKRRGGGMPRPTPGLTDGHARRRCWWGSRGST